ncbi:MAG: ribonuclease E/G, partial [Armatimonadetes bacterium]|nr:ribonuclease E/G [Armatimonadota bacterium]
MSKEIIVNVGERETRVAVLENDKLVELHIERSERVVGSIYKARVMNVLPALDAAFVDISLERNAFLYVGDVIPTSGANGNASDADQGSDESQELLVKYTPRTRNRTEPVHTPVLTTETLSLGRAENADEEDPAEIAYAAEMAEEAAAEAGMDLDEDILDPDDEPVSEESSSSESPRRRPPPRNNFRKFGRSMLRNQRVKDVLKVGQELLVQVIKGSHSTKGARVSTRISLPGRYLVLMPEGDNLGVSRKIEEARERDRLKRIGEALRPDGFGLIIRTEAEEKTEQELKQDMEFLLRTWRQIQDTSRKVKAPALVQADLTLLSKTIRDVFGSDVDKLVIDDPEEYEKANELL